MKHLFILFFSLAVYAQQQRSVVLTWVDTKNPPTATYNVYRAPVACAATAPTPVFTKINTAGVAPKTYTDMNVAVGQSYCYYVTAQVNTHESVPSNNTEAPINPLPPENVTVTIQVTVTTQQ